jgi:hypothetical protein
VRRIALLILVGAFVAVGMLGIWVDLQQPGSLIGNIVFSTWLAAVLAVGALIVWRHPDNAVGWLFVVASVTMAIALTSKSYAWAAYFGGLDLPARTVAAWLSHWLAVPAAGLLLFAMLLFPAGRLPSPRWHWPSRVLAMAFVLAAVGPMFKPGAIDGLRNVQNPYSTSWGDLAWTVSQVSQPIVVVLAGALILSLVLRSRRADLVQRQQIKWVAYAVAMLPVVFAASAVAQAIDKSHDDVAGFAIIVLGLLAIPIAIGLAILRYRLYEVDLVVNRTIVYVLLTIVLGATYVGGVALFQAIIPVAKENDIAVAASTLAIAALFQPVRRWIQGWIDHLFYRRKYDAQRTIDAFSGRLRDEIDLDALNDELARIVSRTMQPSHLSVWLLSNTKVGDQS